ncbi:DUF2812 domain-containing protein [Sutcliffiella horikoshii]|uniref:DUF2812 domain-containing protein n=1 Tax=Sutcliffiella horikoshii TaxID=79883 RepID=UPI00203F987D|nr:DUF2812 domain-containing protein [Sutcliffiella horikoshii]MCM3618397.1 DUF2812 domain-containing protein [Sutcliffiella horikoshii]
MKTDIKPLWSYDVQKTEQWLSDKAKAGYHLKELHRFKRGFTFEKGNPKEVTFRIGYDKIKTATLSNTMRNDGWEKVTQSGKWYVIANERPQAEVTTSTSRDAIIKRKRGSRGESILDHHLYRCSSSHRFLCIYGLLSLENKENQQSVITRKPNNLFNTFLIRKEKSYESRRKTNEARWIAHQTL